jgi:hypothetical protein
MNKAAANFERDRYLVLPALLNKSLLKRFYSYVCEAVESDKGGLQDHQLPDTPFAYGDFITDGLMAGLLPQIEKSSGLKLFPTYSYCRVYKHGDVLSRHTDRVSCEVSISICLGYKPNKPWPFWIEGPKGPSSIILKPGDAVLYRGIECPHWREAFAGEYQAQIFLHYVDQNGPYADWKFDKRAALGDRPAIKH